MRCRPALLVAGFALLLALGLARHEMWRDELQAWMLAGASPSPAALVANMSHEGHPALWQLLLLPLARAGAPVEAMQVVHFLVALVGVSLFVAWAPFPLAARALFACSYLPLFEYGVISRDYALALPLLWTTCHLWERDRRPWLALGALLALLANCNPYAWLLAGALLAAIGVESALAPGRRRDATSRPAEVAGGLLLALGGLAGALWQMVPPPDALYAHGPPLVSVPRALRAAGTLASAYLPFPDWQTLTPWNSALVFRLAPPLLATLAVLGIGAAFTLLPAPGPRALFAFGTAALLAFTYLRYIGWARHHGHHVLLFVACCWLAARTPEATDRWRRTRHGALAALLAVHLATAAWLYGADLMRPFSTAKAAAATLASPSLAALPAVGYPDPVLPAVGGYRGAPLLSLVTGRPLSFVVWQADDEPRRGGFEVCVRLAARLRTTGSFAFVAPLDALASPCPLLTAEPIGPAPPPPLVPSERLAVWRITAPP